MMYGTIRRLPSGEEIWFDATTTHPTGHKLYEGAATDQAPAGRQGRQAYEVRSSVGIKKRDKYALLKAIAQRQMIPGLREVSASMYPPTVHGEFFAGTNRLQDWLIGKFEQKLANDGNRGSGQNFRRRC